MTSQLSNPYNDSIEQLKKRALLHMKEKSVNDKMRNIAEEHFVDEFLRGENVVLTRNEKRGLFKAVLREIFEEILAGF